MRFPRIFAVLVLLLSTAFGLNAEAATTKYKVGDTTVHIVVSGSGGYTMVALHENESTSVQAAKKVIRQSGGRLVELQHSKIMDEDAALKRNVSFTFKGKSYTFDPNRMFTDLGIKRNLQPYSVEAHNAVKGLASEVMRHINGRVIILSLIHI